MEEVASTKCYNALIRDTDNHSAIIRTERKGSLKKMTICAAYPFPKRQILDSYKLKGFAYENFEFGEKWEKVL